MSTGHCETAIDKQQLELTLHLSFKTYFSSCLNALNQTQEANDPSKQKTEYQVPLWKAVVLNAIAEV